MNLQPTLDDIRFMLHDVLQVPAQLQALPAFAETDADLMRQVVDEAGKFVPRKIAPLQEIGDSVGCKFVSAIVTIPPGIKAAYHAFWQADWPARPAFCTGPASA